MTISHLRGGLALIGTAAELATANPVLLQRQLSLETDTGVEKIGDGTTHYASLTAVPGGGGASTAMTDVIALHFNKTGLVGTDGVVLVSADLTVVDQKGTDLSVVDVEAATTQAVVISESGGSFGVAVFYNVKSTVLDAGSSDLRIFSFTLSTNNGPGVSDRFSAGIDSVTPLVLNVTISETRTGMPFTDVPAGGWVGGQMAGFQVNGAAGDRFNLNGRIMVWRIA